MTFNLLSTMKPFIRRHGTDQEQNLLLENCLHGNALNTADSARLLAASHHESEAWLHALPLSNLGLRLDDDSVRIVVALCLGTPLCAPHHCQRCGQSVDPLDRHGLSCRRSDVDTQDMQPSPQPIFPLVWNPEPVQTRW